MKRFTITPSVLFLGLVVLAPLSSLAQSLVSAGKWRGVFHSSNGTEVPFNFEVRGKSGSVDKIYLLNGDERFETSQVIQKSDSLFIPFDQFDTELAFKIKDKQLTGLFRRKDHAGRTIPVDATFGQAYRFDDNGEKPSMILHLSWKVGRKTRQWGYSAKKGTGYLQLL